jgi:hypothetical protein
MHNNPVTRGLVNTPEDWPRSSWRFYYLEDASILRMNRTGRVQFLSSPCGRSQTPNDRSLRQPALPKTWSESRRLLYIIVIRKPKWKSRLKQLGVVAERNEVAVFGLRHHTRMIANQEGSVYFTRCSAANAVYREDPWRRRSKHTELES